MAKLAKIAQLPDWSRRFDRPIFIQNRQQPLRTLRDAAIYVSELPAVEQDAPRWKTAAEMLTMNAEHGGDLAPTRRAVLHALHNRELQASSKRGARIVRIIR